VTTSAPRRELLLTAAADLFAARGFHDVGIDDIGAAAGITGPGVYRHFASKQALLESLCDRTMDRMLGLAQAVPAGSLEGLVDLHVEFAVSERALLSVWVREQRALDEDVTRSLRARQRTYEQLWRDALACRRTEVALVVGAALAMLNTTSLIDSPLPAAQRVAVLRRLTLAALLA
jgi:AcrR family transcriptional regulator